MLPLRAYASLASDDLNCIAERRDAIAADALAFFSPALHLLPERNFHMIAEILAASALDAAMPTLQRAARFCMWMYLLDYYVDEAQVADDAAVQRIHANVEEILDGGLPNEFLYGSLTDIMASYRDLPNSTNFLSAFQQQIRKELWADRQIMALSKSPRPDPMQYLHCATFGVNHMSCSLSLLLSAWPETSTAQLHALRPALWRAARAVRFANDLRTHAKDDAEGLIHSLRFWPEATLRAAITRHLTRMDGLLQRFVRSGGAPEAALALGRLARIGVEVYGFTDIRYDDDALRHAARVR